MFFIRKVVQVIRAITQQLAQRNIQGFNLEDSAFKIYQCNGLKRLISILVDFFKVKRRSRLQLQWRRWQQRGRISIDGPKSQVKILSKDGDIAADIGVNLLRRKSSITLYLGRGLSGSLELDVYQANSTLYIGDGCSLGGLEIISSQDNDEILIGNQVKIGHAKRRRQDKVSLFSGGHSPNSPFLIIGDDCLFSYGVTVRTTDAHPIIDRHSHEQVNTPQRGVLIEPHVWIGQNVSILKDVCLGACSIIALGAVVLKDVPRRSLVSGVPARYRPLNGKIWLDSHHPKAIAQAIEWWDFCDQRDIEEDS